MMDQHWRSVVHHMRMRHGGNDGLDDGHSVHQRSVVDDRGVHDGMGNDGMGDQLGGRMVDNVAICVRIGDRM